MTLTLPTTMPDLVLRSLDATWNKARWERLPADGNRYEVIDGVLYMTTAPSNFHQWIISQIAFGLYEQLVKQQFGKVLWAPIGLFMPGCDPVQPDLLFIRNDQLDIMHDRRIFGVPALLIEVLSPSNPEQDTQIKLAAYAAAGVPEYWIVRPAQRDLLVYTQPIPLTSSYARCDHVPSDGDLASPTLPFRSPVVTFFVGAPDETV
jgi:Uma2 family endonuclease